MDGRTDGRKIFTQYSGISSCSKGSTYYFSLFSRMVVLTRSNKACYIFHQTRSSWAKACPITYDKWKALPIPSKVLIVPNAVKKKHASILAQSPSTPQQSPKKNDTAPPTDTTVPLPLPLKREMYTQICCQECYKVSRKLRAILWDDCGEWWSITTPSNNSK